MFPEIIITQHKYCCNAKVTIGTIETLFKFITSCKKVIQVLLKRRLNLTIGGFEHFISNFQRTRTVVVCISNLDVALEIFDFFAT